VASLSVCLGACGGEPDRVIVRVGASVITRSALLHWMSVLAPGHDVPDSPGYGACEASRRKLVFDADTRVLEQECAQQYDALREQALRWLISARWVIGEAQDRGLAPSPSSVGARLRPRRDALLATGATIADAKFQVEVELAAQRLRLALDGGRPVSRAEAVRYYRRHIHRFERPETRNFAIVENLPSEEAARALMRKLSQGADAEGLPLHESLERPTNFASRGGKKAILEAIFAAKPHVLSGPTRLRGRYSVFEVTRVTPPTRRPLARVLRSVTGTLSAERRRRELTRFIAEWRRRWLSRTACSPGYIVQKCREYKGPRTPEDPLAFS
jgi:hypothetical protein